MLKAKMPEFRNKSDYDDSKLISEQGMTLNDGRPIIAQVWAESGYTFLTYFCPSEEIEHFKATDLIAYLQANGINYNDNDNFKPEVSHIKDDNQVSCWRVTLVIGESEE